MIGRNITWVTKIINTIEFPAYGQLRASNELRKQGIFVSLSGIRSIWLRHSLATMRQRLKALEKKSAGEGLILTESQLMALEKKDTDQISLTHFKRS